VVVTSDLHGLEGLLCRRVPKIAAGKQTAPDQTESSSPYLPRVRLTTCLPLDATDPPYGEYFGDPDIRGWSTRRWSTPIR
jgi:hypothetical protein